MERTAAKTITLLGHRENKLVCLIITNVPVSSFIHEEVHSITQHNKHEAIKIYRVILKGASLSF